MAHNMHTIDVDFTSGVTINSLRETGTMADTMNTAHFDRTIRTLETKLARQRSAVMDTEEMIKAVQALKEKEVAAHNTTTTKK